MNVNSVGTGFYFVAGMCNCYASALATSVFMWVDPLGASRPKHLISQHLAAHSVSMGSYIQQYIKITAHKDCALM